MNGTSTNKGQIYIIVCSQVILALICVYTMCRMAYEGKEIPQALSLLTGGLVGSIATMLTKTTPTETTKQPLPQPPHPPAPPNGAHVTATIDNPPSDPVHTEESQENVVTPL